MASACASSRASSSIICVDPVCQERVIALHEMFCAITGTCVQLDQTAIGNFSQSVSEWEKFVTTGPDSSVGVADIDVAQQEAFKKLHDHLHGVYDGLCEGHQFWFRRSMNASSTLAFYKEISFVFERREKTVEKDQSMEHLSPEQKLRVVVQQTREGLTDPGVCEMLQTHFPIIQGLDLAQSIAFEMMRRDFCARCQDKRHLPLFERDILEFLREL